MIESAASVREVVEAPEDQLEYGGHGRPPPDDRHAPLPHPRSGEEHEFSPAANKHLGTRDGPVHMDTLDLCKAKARESLVKATGAELFIDEQVIKNDVGKLLLHVKSLAMRISTLRLDTRSHTTATWRRVREYGVLIQARTCQVLRV